jgi:hypothetical protein
MKFLMSLLAALFMVGSAQAGKAGPFVVVAQDATDAKHYFGNQKLGTVSTFIVSVDTEAGNLVFGDCKMEVTKVGDGQVVFKQTMGDNSADFGGMSSDGYYCWGPVDPDTNKVTPVMALFKYGAKVGDTWDGWAKKPSPDSPDVVVKYIASDETITVPAGDFKVMHVQATVTNGPTVDYYFAEGKGLIRIDTKTGNHVKHLALRNFTEGK